MGGRNRPSCCRSNGAAVPCGPVHGRTREGCVVVMTSGKRGSLVAAVILPLTWLVAGAVNANGFIMGSTPSAAGVVTTLVTACAWPVAGWFAGSQSEAGFIRLATVFWITVVAGAPLVFWALNTAPGMTVSQGGMVLPILLFALAAPLYGLTAVLPSWEPIVQTVVIGVAIFAMTLVGYLARRRIGRRSAQAGPV